MPWYCSCGVIQAKMLRSNLTWNNNDSTMSLTKISASYMHKIRRNEHKNTRNAACVYMLTEFAVYKLPQRETERCLCKVISNITVHVQEIRKCQRTVLAVSRSCWLGGYSGCFDSKHGVHMASSSQIGMPCLPDTWVTPHKQPGGMLYFSLLFFCIGILGHNRLPLRGILSIC